VRSAWTAALGAILAWIAPAAAQESGGSFLLNGLDVKGQVYSATIDIGFMDGAAMVEWLATDAPSRAGYGLQLGQVVGVVAAETGQGQGIALYRIENGRLDGILNPVGTHIGSTATEILTGATALGGAYVLAGRHNDGTAYSGSVEITPTGETYEVDWVLSGLRFMGRGVRLGNTLIVAYAEGDRPQVWAYCVAPSVQAGLTADGAGTHVTPEVIIPLEADFPDPDWIGTRLQKLQADPRIDCPVA
jgi:hypothetical protein